MSKFIKSTLLISLCVSMLILTGCVRLLLPTSDVQLVQQSIKGGYQAELDINYVQAYANLKNAYDKCVAYQSRVPNDFSYIAIDGKLDRDGKKGTIEATANYGTYVSQVVLTEITDEKTLLTLYMAKSKMLTANKNLALAEKRFELEKSRALGQDAKCN